MPVITGWGILRPPWRACFRFYDPDVIESPMPANLLEMTLPRVGIVATRATAMAAAMSAYSMAVAPDSSFMNSFTFFIFGQSFFKLVLVRG
jgi:hypothetical protein